jgi:hypothetical protein
MTSRNGTAATARTVVIPLGVKGSQIQILSSRQLAKRLAGLVEAQVSGPISCPGQSQLPTYDTGRDSRLTRSFWIMDGEYRADLERFRA